MVHEGYHTVDEGKTPTATPKFLKFQNTKDKEKILKLSWEEKAVHLVMRSRLISDLTNKHEF